MFKRLLLAALIFYRCVPLHAYVYAYDRLHHNKTNVVIDILHDDHQPERYLSRRNMERKPLSYIKDRLYKTEQRVLDALLQIQRVNPARVELIWEVGKFHSPEDSAFIGHAHGLVKKQFPQLSFIAGDLARDAFEDILCIRPLHRPKNLAFSLDGTSVGKPVPLPDSRVKAIEKNYGSKGCEKFKQYFSTITTRATNLYKKGFLSGKRFRESDFNRVSCFDALCDAELVSHILASDKKHIIVYCGSWHGDNLTEFLVKKVGFKLTQEKFNQGYELKVGDLASLDKDYQGPGTAPAS